MVHLDISGTHFTYSGTSSRDYGLIFANVKTDRFISLVGDIKSNTVFNKSGKYNHFIGDSFEDAYLVFDAEVVTDNGNPIHFETRRNIEKWLFHQTDYRRLYLDVADDPWAETCDLVDGVPKHLYLNCRFVNPEKLEYNGGIVGYRFKIECDSCMAWQDETVCNYKLNHDSQNSNSMITLAVDTDINDYTYPRVTIQMGTLGGDIIISNNTDEPARLTSFVGLSPGIKLTMDGCGINYISGDNYMKFSDKNFIRLLDGENSLSVIGNIAEITFEFQNRRYL